jgi:hypothetical protein
VLGWAGAAQLTGKSLALFFSFCLSFIYKTERGKDLPGLLNILEKCETWPSKYFAIYGTATERFGIYLNPFAFFLIESAI